MGRYENVAVFEDTKKLCKENKKISSATKISVNAQELVLESDSILTEKKVVYTEKAKVVVSKKRTLEAASSYQGERTAVHNFASATNPGGGVVNGSSAQEECLCRCSNLYFCLNTQPMWNGFYGPHRNERNPLHNDDIIYTPDVTVFKTDTADPKLMPEEKWYCVDVITCAAPNLREKPGNRYNSGDGSQSVKVTDKELLAIHEKRLRRILDVALSHKVTSIVLGAFGCGAFQNNPEVVALAAKNVVKDYLYSFKNIEFAVYCSGTDDWNYKVFLRHLSGLK